MEITLDNTVARRQHQINYPKPQQHMIYSGIETRNKREIEMNLNFTTMQTPPSLSTQEKPRKHLQSISKWAESDTDTQGELFEDLDKSDRSLFLKKYNVLAEKYSVCLMSAHELKSSTENPRTLSTRQESWFSRKILRRQSSTQITKPESVRNLKCRRSFSEISAKLINRKDKLEFKNLQELSKLCGASHLYLPSEYAAGSLLLPTCFRALAQFLVKHGTNVRGLFRISGSHNIVNDLYNYYCYYDKGNGIVAGTVRSPNLPDHIKYDVYDVASALKRFLIGLPGGILGSLTLFNAFISIKTQLNGGSEADKTKLCSVRARLIALAVLTMSSQYRRALICAIFGLLSMIGRAAETAKNEDKFGRPLPTSDLMGYRPLGIIFGPILVGNLLEDYRMQILSPKAGLVLLPLSSPKSKKEQKSLSAKSHDETKAASFQMDKVEIANSVTEMLITQWSDVVRHLRILTSQYGSRNTLKTTSCGNKHSILRPYASESSTLRNPPEWMELNRTKQLEENFSPLTTGFANFETTNRIDACRISLRKQPSKLSSLSNYGILSGKPLSILSMTAEETPNNRIGLSPVCNKPRLTDPSNDMTVLKPNNGKYHSVDPENILASKFPKKNSDFENLRTNPTNLSPSHRKSGSSSRMYNSSMGTSPPRIGHKADRGNGSNGKMTKHKNRATEDQAEVSATHSNSLGPFMKSFTPAIKKQLHLKADTSRLKNNFTGISSRIFLRDLKRQNQAFSSDFEEALPQSPPQTPGIESRFKFSTRKYHCKMTSFPPYDNSKDKLNLEETSKILKNSPVVRLSQEDNSGTTEKLSEVSDSSFSRVFNAGNGKKYRNQNFNITICPDLNRGGNEKDKFDSFMNHNNESDPLSGTISRSTSHRSQKMLELLAKFDNVSESQEMFKKIDTPSLTQHNPSPVETQNSGNQIKDRLLASYTTNFSSPSKSRMSHRSDATLKKTPSLHHSENMTIASSNTPYDRSIGPKMHTGESAINKKIISKPREPKITSSPFNSNLCSFPLRSVKSSVENLSTAIPEPCVKVSSTLSSPQSDGHSSAESHLLTLLTNAKSSRKAKGLLPKLNPQRSPTRNTQNILQNSSTETLQRSYTDKHPTLRCLSTEDLVDLIHINSEPQGASRTHKNQSPIINATSCLPSSLLYDQIRSLQRQLNRKYEDIQIIRQQISVRQNIIISSLAEQLRDSEKLVQFWQGRAQLYEQRFHTLNHSLSEFSPRNAHDHSTFTGRTNA